MNEIEEGVTRVRRFIAQQPKWSKFRLASAAGLHRNTLRGLDSPDWNPRIETVRLAVAAIERIERAAVEAA